MKAWVTGAWVLMRRNNFFSVYSFYLTRLAAFTQAIVFAQLNVIFVASKLHEVSCDIVAIKSPEFRREFAPV